MFGIINKRGEIQISIGVVRKKSKISKRGWGLYLALKSNQQTFTCSNSKSLEEGMIFAQS